jgi:hypothetical protein
MRETFASAYAKLDRAAQHLDDLKRLLVEHTSRPDLVKGTVEYRPDAPADRNLIPHFRVQALPHTVAAVAGDVVHNLRSALDHVAWQLVLTNGGTPVEPGSGRRATQFPILTDEPGTLEVAGVLSSEALDIVRAAQPYASPGRPGRLLAALRHISNTDKHREAVRGYHGVSNWVTWREPDSPTGPWTAPVEVAEANENGAEIRFYVDRGRPGERGGMNLYGVEVEMGPGGPYEPLHRTLDDIAWVVRQLVDQLVDTVSDSQ